MPQITRAFLILTCVVITAFSQDYRTDMPDAQQQAIEKAILSVHAEMKKAAENLDAEALYDHVLDTGTPPIVEDGRLARTRQDAAQSTKRGLQGLKKLSYSYDRHHVTVISPTAALWVAEGSALATIADGREISAPFAETIVFVQRDGQWKVLHAHRSAPNQR